MRKLFSLAILIFAIFPAAAYAQSPLNLDSPSVILVEQSTGRVLYLRNERERRYPASLTKMLTALVAVEYLALGEEITVGTEIRNMPAGFATNVHTEGETLSVETLLYSLLVRSANETGRILALNVARRHGGRHNISYGDAERIFSVLLNEKARSLGTTGTHFNNPFGAHNDHHFTTAYDLALITRAFMDNEILARIAATHTVEEFSWTNTNQMLPGAPQGYAHMTGAKAGFTTPAGQILAGAAYNDGLKLVTVVLGGTDPARWQDTRRLMDYGFNNFRFREIARDGEIIATVQIENPRLGDSEFLEVISREAFTALLSRAEYAEITREISFDPLLYVENEYETPTLRAPIEYGEVIGTITYRTGGETIFEAPVLAAREVYARSFDTDMDYYIAALRANIFSLRGLPYWFGIFGTIFGITGIAIAVKTHRRAARNAGWTYAGNKRGRYSRYD